MINRKSIVNSPDDRLRQFNRMPIPSYHPCSETQFTMTFSYLNQLACVNFVHTEHQHLYISSRAPTPILSAVAQLHSGGL